ncbi:3-deoxy-D-manno-octulosonic acid transferase [Polluticoccus soli]|uniref:3-deoxy-D-manno-octulosonic acid transferase n=1 Tax=Polluticoccus soli TaxID=3034150 RepID=UPI0023E2DB9D|nr:glycosyltransferase N-terminal domain-containing protein [Flavipsychrobacter sp. JY13-12]
MSSAIYWLAIRFYGLAAHVVSVFDPKAKLFVKGRQGLLAHIKYALINERRPRIWMHCASLGEFEQGRPLLEEMRRRYPHYAFVLTFFSPSGYEARKTYSGADYVFYLPLDGPNNATQFIKTVQPHLALFVKYELWYFYLSRLAAQNIPAILISAIFREDQPFFKWYGRLHRRMLHSFSHIFVQNEESVQMLGKAGVTNVTRAGDTRFDRVVEASQANTPIAIAQAYCKGAKMLVAGSTWPDDEDFLQKLMQILPAQWKLILVPHEIDESHIHDIETKFEGLCVKWSTWHDHSSARVLIVDKIGLLLQLYSYADVAWVGGAFNRDGVHNVLEAAIWGRPVAFGPVYDKFLEAKELIAVGGGVTIDTPEAFKHQLLNWKKDQYSYAYACKAARDYVLSKAGATKAIIGHLEAKKLLSVS